MFKVAHKYDETLVYTVYAVDDATSGLYFLVYTGVWHWITAQEYVPVVRD